MKIHTKIALFEGYIKREKLKNDERFLRELAEMKLQNAIAENLKNGSSLILLPKKVRDNLSVR